MAALPDEKARYGARWHARDAYQSLTFTIRHRPARYWGLGCMVLTVAEVGAALAFPAALLPRWAAVGAALAGGLLLMLGGCRRRR